MGKSRKSSYNKPLMSIKWWLHWNIAQRPKVTVALAPNQVSMVYLYTAMYLSVMMYWYIPVIYIVGCMQKMLFTSCMCYSMKMAHTNAD